MTRQPVLCLIGCCKKKLPHAAPARELYCSPLFRLCLAWAQQHADAWAILSARYGIVRPDEVIGPYDNTIAQRRPFGGKPLTPPEYDGWMYGHAQARFICHYATPTQQPRLIVLAGKDYWRGLVAHGLKVETPLDGLGIGERLRWLKQQTATARPETGRVPGQLLLFPELSKQGA
jgi:hypothetical protein